MFVSSFLIVFVVLFVAWVRRVCIPPPWRSDSPSPARRAHFFGRPLRAGAPIDPHSPCGLLDSQSGKDPPPIE